MHEHVADSLLEGARLAVSGIEVALRDGPKHFVELMAARSSRDGREIVRELELLKGVKRDEEGRYFL